MILMDTDVCIELLRGNKKIIEKRKSIDAAVAVSFMTVAELLYGAEKSDKKEKNTSLLDIFLLTVNIINTDIEIFKEAMTFVSADEDEWWRQMLHLGWDSLIKKIEVDGFDQVEKLKEKMFQDLQPFKHSDGIHFEKEVFYISSVK